MDPRRLKLVASQFARKGDLVVLLLPEGPKFRYDVTYGSHLMNRRLFILRTSTVPGYFTFHGPAALFEDVEVDQEVFVRSRADAQNSA